MGLYLLIFQKKCENIILNCTKYGKYVTLFFIFLRNCQKTFLLFLKKSVIVTGLESIVKILDFSFFDFYNNEWDYIY